MREPLRKSDRTFTLRLTEDEAEALERMTYIENEIRPGGQSKNNFIKELIAKEYANYDAHAVINNKIRFITQPDVFAVNLSDTIEHYSQRPDKIAAALAAIHYAYNELASEFKEENREEYDAIISKLDNEHEYLTNCLKKISE